MVELLGERPQCPHHCPRGRSPRGLAPTASHRRWHAMPAELVGMCAACDIGPAAPFTSWLWSHPPLWLVAYTGLASPPATQPMSMSRGTAADGECPFIANQSFEPLGTRRCRATLTSSIRCPRVANSRRAHCRYCSRSKKAAAETEQRVVALGEYSNAHPPEGFVQRGLRRAGLRQQLDRHAQPRASLALRFADRNLASLCRRPRNSLPCVRFSNISAGPLGSSTSLSASHFSTSCKSGTW